jgi:HEPN domain-containing protein
VKAEERLNRELSITRALKTPVNFIVHTLDEVNEGLADGRFFFMDVARDGVAIYQSDDRELAEPRPKTPAQALAIAEEYFDEWFATALQRFELAKIAREKGFVKPAAFDLHQTAEFLYHCVLLVCTFYTPHVHNLSFLRTQAERLDRRLAEVWPTSIRKERAMFEKLKDAYVKARYSKHYQITADELAWLSERVSDLANVVQSVCLERIGTLKRTGTT